MNIDYLKAFYTTVKSNSISKAAKKLHLTQPGLSMQIQSLERELQVSLLNRSNRGVELTEAGKIVFNYSDTILSLKDNLERDLENLKTNKRQLSIGACKAIGEYALPCSIYVYKQDNENVDINLQISNTKDVIQNLINRTVNIGIIHSNVESPQLNIQKITSDNLVLVTSLPLVKDKISISELINLPLIFREKGSGTRYTIEEDLNKHGISSNDLNIVYELNSMEAIKSSVIAGKGMAFIPEMSVKRELYNGTLKEIVIEELQIVSDFSVAYMKNTELSPCERDFIKFIKSSKRGFCQEDF
ncbi:LysR substrate-binding domain-containing protein [Dethiothermospora halolimnae]|uniref:LysR substrate-binding domain-containing protein n=1 Tax=Dethiothermospora halolimnae TaxID=3114390 RepID=UPI003CCB96FA